MSVQFTCRRCTELIIDFVAEELAEEDKKLFEMHLGECPPCVAMVKSYRITITMVKKLPAKPCPPAVIERVKKIAEEQKPSEAEA
jgi:anti-sigma factor RsiW